MGSSVHGIIQARIPEWVAIIFSKGSSLPRDWTWVSCISGIGRRVLYILQFSSVQLLSRVRLFATLWIAARQASLSIPNSQSLLKLMPIKLVMPSSHLILCHPLLVLLSLFPSIRVFSSESTLRIRWWKYSSFSFSISPSNEQPGLISFRMGWLDLLAVQGTLKSLPQHHTSKASVFRCSAFFSPALTSTHVFTTLATGSVVNVHVGRWWFLLPLWPQLSCLRFHFINLSVLFFSSVCLKFVGLLNLKTKFSFQKYFVFLLFYFCSDLYYFLPSANFGLSSYFTNSLNCKVRLLIDLFHLF